MSTNAEFDAFLEQFLKCALERDEAFTRSTLPEDIPDDHFSFLLSMREHLAKDIKGKNITPTITYEDAKVTVKYEGLDEDEGMSMEMPFYRKNDSWVCYDPNDPYGDG